MVLLNLKLNTIDVNSFRISEILKAYFRHILKVIDEIF